MNTTQSSANELSTIQPSTRAVVRQRFAVDGMTCSHCERAIVGEVGALAGVTAVRADAATGIVTVDADHELDARQVAAAIGEAGYELVR
jgi:copper chaperone CopZ